MKKYISETLYFLLFILLLFLFIVFFSRIITPKRTEFGATWGPFLKEEQDSIDVLFFGSSLVYCDVIPGIIYEDTGISSYLLAGPTINIPTLYYYIEEMFKTQTPETIFVEITGFYFTEDTEFDLVNIGHMPWSMNKMKAIFTAAQKDDWLNLLFPPYLYHDRWMDIKLADYKPYKIDNQSGYTYLDDTCENPVLEERSVAFDQDHYDRNLSYLEKISRLCAEKDVSLIYYFTPSFVRLNDHYIQMLKADLDEAGAYYSDYVDFNDYFMELNIVPEQDFYDLGHFNFRGAEKFSHYLSDYIIENCPPELRKGDDALWQERINHYQNIEKPE